MKERTHTNASYWTDLMSRTDDFEDLEMAIQNRDAGYAEKQLRDAIDFARRRINRETIREIFEEEMAHGR